MLRHGNAQRPRYLLYQKLVQFSYDIHRNGHNMGSKSCNKRLIITTEIRFAYMECIWVGESTVSSSIYDQAVGA